MATIRDTTTTTTTGEANRKSLSNLCYIVLFRYHDAFASMIFIRYLFFSFIFRRFPSVNTGNRFGGQQANDFPPQFGYGQQYPGAGGFQGGAAQFPAQFPGGHGAQAYPYPGQFQGGYFPGGEFELLKILFNYVLNVIWKLSRLGWARWLPRS